MKKNLLTVISIFLIGLTALSACNLPGQTSQPENPQAIFTAAAQTIAARVTLESVASATPGNTQVLPASTATSTQPGAPTATATQSNAPTATATSVPPTAVPPTAVPPTFTPTATQVPPTATRTATRLPPTATPIPCHWAQFIRDVTVADGTPMLPGAKFTKIWRIKNIGTCAWTPKYAVAFVDGTAMTKTTSVLINKTVNPGEVVDVGVNLTAPNNEGKYSGKWALRTPGGVYFGIGKSADIPFWVAIKVAKLSNTNFAYDFAAHYCDADWESKDGAISCARAEGDFSGHNILLTAPHLETREENELALWVRPDDSKNGFISASYPFYTIKEGDRFVTQIGCLYGSAGCNVTFQLNYMLSNGTVKNLGSWDEVYDKKARIVNIDLSSLAGTSVSFILTVSNNGKWAEANAFWFVPSIRNTPPSTNPTVTPTVTLTPTSPPSTNP